MKTYIGKRTKAGVEVWISEDGVSVPLEPEASLAIWDDPWPDGFEWGYGGSGSSLLALAIVLDFTGSPDIASSCYMAFKSDFIGPAKKAGFRIEGSEIERWLSLREIGT